MKLEDNEGTVSSPLDSECVEIDCDEDSSDKLICVAMSLASWRMSEECVIDDSESGPASPTSPIGHFQVIPTTVGAFNKIS